MISQLPTQSIHAPKGLNLSCKGWQQEAAMRMLMNNLDPQVAEDPDQLIVYGGSGKAARNWDCYHKIIDSLKKLNDDETLLVQSGKPVGVFKTHDQAPRVLIANSHLVPKWANFDEFRRLEAMGLTMYGQMTAGSWIYIGSQGILQGTYETFAACAEKHFSGSLEGKLVVSAGLGGMGGAQPLAATLNGACFLGFEVDRQRIEKRLETKYLDKMTENLDEALKWIQEAQTKGEALSVAVLGNVAELLPELENKSITVDILTDQTSAHDLHLGYIPKSLSLEQAALMRVESPKEYESAVLDSMQEHISCMLRFQEKGSIVFDYGNNLRGQVADNRGQKEAFKIPGFIPEYIRPLFCKGSGPFRWAALSGDPQDIYTTDKEILSAFPQKTRLCNWIKKAQQKIQFQGIPSRICWLEFGERAEMGARFNHLVKKGKIKAPIVIGRDHLDCGSVASPNRETENMKDGSDAIADWPILNALLNTSCGASWVSLHHGGGVGIGYSIHAGMVCVADGTDRSQSCLERVLTADPGIGVARHADAGYEEAIEHAKSNDINLPMLNN